MRRIFALLFFQASSYLGLKGDGVDAGAKGTGSLWVTGEERAVMGNINPKELILNGSWEPEAQATGRGMFRPPNL